MKFSDFTVKRLLSSGDYIVGYDEDGNNIRISKSDLASALASSVQAQSVQVQYSSNGNTWHATYASSDRYMRIKAGSGAWSSAISIAVSAYDIWLSEGNVGTKEDFLSSLKGEDGNEADLSSLTLQRISGYDQLLQNVNAAISNAKAAIISEVTEESKESVMAQFLEMQLSDVQEVRNITDKDYLTIVTADGLKKVSLGSLIDNVSVKTVSSSNLEKAVVSQQAMFTLSGNQNGSNVNFHTTREYVHGTSNVYYNGQRLVLGKDYCENDSQSITMLTHVPEASDSIVFIAVMK